MIGNFSDCNGRSFNLKKLLDESGTIDDKLILSWVNWKGAKEMVSSEIEALNMRLSRRLVRALIPPLIVSAA